MHLVSNAEAWGGIVAVLLWQSGGHASGEAAGGSGGGSSGGTAHTGLDRAYRAEGVPCRGKHFCYHDILLWSKVCGVHLTSCPYAQHLQSKHIQFMARLFCSC